MSLGLVGLSQLQPSWGRVVHELLLPCVPNDHVSNRAVLQLLNAHLILKCLSSRANNRQGGVSADPLAVHLDHSHCILHVKRRSLRANKVAIQDSLIYFSSRFDVLAAELQLQVGASTADLHLEGEVLRVVLSEARTALLNAFPLLVEQGIVVLRAEEGGGEVDFLDFDVCDERLLPVFY